MVFVLQYRETITCLIAIPLDPWPIELFQPDWNGYNPFLANKSSMVRITQFHVNERANHHRSCRDVYACFFGLVL